jgi:tetratricopeptide (TPR) repeat protein
MQKQQIIVVFGGLILLAGLYLLVPTVNPKKGAKAPETGSTDSVFRFENFEKDIIAQLSESRQQYISGALADVKRGDVATQENAYWRKMETFWRDSVPVPPLHYFYQSKLAELDNTEKSLTFAAHSILSYLPYERNHPVQHWLAGRGRELFEKALVLNPANDSATVGLGGCIMYGGAAEGDNPMAGILKVREVAEKDSNNLFAQYMLGVGGVISGQFDKAISRFEKVVQKQPNNIELLFKLAETCEQAGKKADAADWYERINSLVGNPDMKKELTARIEALRKG